MANSPIYKNLTKDQIKKDKTNQDKNKDPNKTPLKIKKITIF